MPNVWVRDQNTWKLVKRLYVRDNSTWKTGGVLRVRDQTQGGWANPTVWSPTTPQNVAVPLANYNEYTQTTLNWTASTGGQVDHYEIRRSTWSADRTTVVATSTTSNGSTNPSGVVTGVTEKTYYSYEVRAIGTVIDPTTGQKAASDWSSIFRWKVGNSQKTRSDPNYGWGPDIEGGYVPQWQSWSSMAETPGYPASRVADASGVNSPPWGYLANGSNALTCNAEFQTTATGRWDIRGNKAGFPPSVNFRPNNRVKINYIACGHYGVTGYRNIFPGVNMYSMGRQQYFFDRMSAANATIHRFIDNLYVDCPVGDTSWRWDYAGSSAIYAQQADINPDAGEYIAVFIGEWTPVFFSDPGPGVMPMSLPNLRYIQWWYNNWQITSYTTTITENAAPGVPNW